MGGISQQQNERYRWHRYSHENQISQFYFHWKLIDSGGSLRRVCVHILASILDHKHATDILYLESTYFEQQSIEAFHIIPDIILNNVALRIL